MIPPAPLGREAAADHFGPASATGACPDAAVERRFSFELAACPGSVALARRMTRARLTGWALSEDACDTAALVVSELVTNAIVHAAGHRVVCELHDRGDLVRIAVRDEGHAPGEPHPSPQRPEEEHGRGLLLVEAVCRAWGARKAGPGLLVWADVPRGGVPAPTHGGVPAPHGGVPVPHASDVSRPAHSRRPLKAVPHPVNAVPHPADHRCGDTAARSDLGWSAKRPPTEDRGNGAEASHGTHAAHGTHEMHGTHELQETHGAPATRGTQKVAAAQQGRERGNV